MKCNLKVVGKTLIASVSGDIDHHSSSEIKESLVYEYVSKGCIDLIFDFTLLDFMDSAGVGMIIGRYKQMSINGGGVYAVGVTPPIERIFKLSGLNKLIKLYPTVDAALAACNSGREVV